MKEWFKKHLNWTWIIVYSLAICLAYSLVAYVGLQPKPTKMVSIYVRGEPIVVQGYDSKGNRVPDIVMDGPMKPIYRSTIDEEAVKAREFSVMIFWFWPVYLLGTILISRWVLKQKNRSLNWLWLTLLVLSITPIILSKKNPTLSDSEQLQTLVEHPSDGCSETHTHSDKTGDI